MRGSFLPRSYRSIHQPRGVFSTVLLKSVAVCFYASRAAIGEGHDGVCRAGVAPGDVARQRGAAEPGYASGGKSDHWLPAFHPAR